MKLNRFIFSGCKAQWIETLFFIDGTKSGKNYDSSTENSNTKQNSSESIESSNNSNTTEDTENTTSKNSQKNNNYDNDDTKIYHNNDNNKNNNNNDNDDDHIYQKGDDFQISKLKTDCSSIVDSVYNNRKMLESEYVSHHLGEWVSLLWGTGQKGLFMPYLYSNQQALENNQIAQEAIPRILENLGATPPKIFDKNLWIWWG